MFCDYLIDGEVYIVLYSFIRVRSTLMAFCKGLLGYCMTEDPTHKRLRTHVCVCVCILRKDVCMCIHSSYTHGEVIID